MAAEAHRLRKPQNGAASPMLSDNRTRSHFGASTQMMAEDGTASQIMQMVDGGHSPMIRPPLYGQTSQITDHANTFAVRRLTPS